MDDDILDLYAAMALERMNIEFMFGPGRSGDVLITCRLRPYKQHRNADRMILAGGYSLDEALALAYVGMVDQRWLPLDWTARATQKGVVLVLAVQEVPAPANDALKRRVEALYGGRMTEPSAKHLNGAQNGAQEQPEQTNSKSQRQR